MTNSLAAARTAADALRRATERLMGHASAPRLDALLIMAHVLELPREYLIAHDETPLTPLQAAVYDKLVTLRAKGMPTAYILGRRPFYDRQFMVTPHVLIPRPETEHVVEQALAWANQRSTLRVVDVGTGSGAIAVTLAAHLPHCRVVATDVSFAAAQIAAINGRDLPNLQVIQADLLTPFSGRFDVICANMPYIATEDLNVLEVAKFEPHVALDGGSDGLRLIVRLLEQIPQRLARPGLVLLEHGADQGPAVAELTRRALPSTEVEVIKDLAGLDRLVRAEIR